MAVGNTTGDFGIFWIIVLCSMIAAGWRKLKAKINQRPTDGEADHPPYVRRDPKTPDHR